MSCLFASSGKSIRPSASASVFPMNIQGEFPLGLTGLISLQSKGLSRVYSSITIPRHQFFSAQVSLLSNSHIYTWLLETTILTIWIFVRKVMSLLFNMLCRFVIAFLTKLFLRAQMFTLIFHEKVLLYDATSTTFCGPGYVWFGSFGPWIQWAERLSILEMKVPFSHPISEEPPPPSCVSFPLVTFQSHLAQQVACFESLCVHFVVYPVLGSWPERRRVIQRLDKRWWNKA